MKLSAVIFDLNGTVLSDEEAWGKAFAKVLETFGIDEKSKYPHIGGIGIEENWPLFIDKYKIKTEKTSGELAFLTKNEYFKLIPEIILKPGFLDFAESLKESDVKIALATSSTWDSVEKVLDTFNITDFFDCITTGEEVSLKKPDPRIFDITVDKLQADPAFCLVFEDSQAGISAATSVGMKVVALFRDELHKKTLIGADEYIHDFTEIAPVLIGKL